MAKLPLTIACGDYDRTRAIKDGATEIEGCEVNYLPLYPEEAFFRAFKYTEFDVSELSFSSYIRTTAAGTSEYIGIPASCLGSSATPAFTCVSLWNREARGSARQARRSAE